MARLALGVGGAMVCASSASVELLEAGATQTKHSRVKSHVGV
jgi:hypothetical protein